MKNIFLTFLLTLTLGIGLEAQFAYAQTEGNCTGTLCYTPLEPLPGLNDESGSGQSLGEVINFVFRTLFALAGLFAVVALILGGISYMTSEIAPTKTKAKDRIKSALLGLAILAFSYLLLNTINPDILTFNFLSSSPSAEPPTNTATTGGPGSNTNSTIRRNQVYAIYDEYAGRDAQLQNYTNQCLALGGSFTTSGGGSDSKGSYSLYQCEIPE